MHWLDGPFRFLEYLICFCDYNDNSIWPNQLGCEIPEAGNRKETEIGLVWILMLKSITLGLVWTHFDEDELNSCQIKIVICETNIWD